MNDTTNTSDQPNTGEAELHTEIGREGVIVEIRPVGQDHVAERDMGHLSDEEAESLRDQLDDYLEGEPTERQRRHDAWEEHNQSFNYEPPQREPEAWPSEAFTELYDRTIQRQTQWVCEKCHKPLSSLKKARSHVRKQHHDSLIETAKARIDTEDEAEADGGTAGCTVDDDQTTLSDGVSE